MILALRAALLAFLVSLAIMPQLGARGDAYASPSRPLSPARADATDGRDATLQQTARRTTRKPQRRTTKKKPTRRRRGRRAVAVIPPMPRTTPRSVDQLRSDLGGMLTRRVRSGEWGVMVLSVTRGDTLFSANAGAPMLPASTMKLLTTAMALDRLGPDYRFSTDVLRDGPVDASGTLNGNLIIRGDGDPAFSRRFHPGAYSTPVTKLADQVARAGIKRVTGSVLGDATAFDPQTYLSGWLSRYRNAGYAARVSALSLNENVVWVTVAPTRTGKPARVWLEPSTTLIPVRGAVRTVRGGGTVVRARNTDDGAISVGGRIGVRSAVRRFGLVIENPARFTTGAFHAALLAKGVTVDGEARLAPTPDSAIKIGSILSPPLDQLLAVMNRESINLFAELLLRNSVRGPQRDRQGSSVGAQSLLRGFFARRLGADTLGLDAHDGSGLSTLDRVSSRQMVQLLHYAHHASWGPTFHTSMPVAGKSELLRRRMKFSPADGNLHAKTGTTNNVIALAGYVTAEGGEVIAFSFLYNGRDRWNAKSTIDVMGETLAGFARP